MSDSSTGSEDGEIERSPRPKRGHSSSHRHHHKQCKKHKTSSREVILSKTSREPSFDSEDHGLDTDEDHDKDVIQARDEGNSDSFDDEEEDEEYDEEDHLNIQIQPQAYRTQQRERGGHESSRNKDRHYERYREDDLPQTSRNYESRRYEDRNMERNVTRIDYEEDMQASGSSSSKRDRNRDLIDPVVGRSLEIGTSQSPSVRHRDREERHHRRHHREHHREHRDKAYRQERGDEKERDRNRREKKNWMSLDVKDNKEDEKERMENKKERRYDFESDKRDLRSKINQASKSNVVQVEAASTSLSLKTKSGPAKLKKMSSSHVNEVQDVELSDIELTQSGDEDEEMDKHSGGDKDGEKEEEISDNHSDYDKISSKASDRSRSDNSDDEDGNERKRDEKSGREEDMIDKNLYKNEEGNGEKKADIKEDEKETPIQTLPTYYPAIQGCRSVEEFQCINRIEEGTYGVVYRARDKRSNQIVALKRLKMEKEKEGFPITSLREINTLLKAQHENIVTVREIVVGSNMDKIYIVMDFVEHDMKGLMESMKQPFLLGEVKTLMRQLLRAVAHLHDNWILHRDLKTSNLLLSHKGILKVGDFGLAREYGSPLKPYTPIVVTLWYRAPELLLQAKQYSYPIDNWSVGCIFGEFLTLKPLFPGKSEIDQLNIIFKDLGTPNEKIWPGYSELPLVKKVNFADHPYNNLHNRLGQKLTKSGFDLMNRFLTYSPSKRISAEDALKHDFFKESPLPIDPSMFPTWPAKSEGVSSSARKTDAQKSPKPPSGGKQFAKQLAGDDDEKFLKGFYLTLPSQGKATKGGFNLKF